MAETYQGFKYELKPNNVQRGIFVQYAGAARFAWNWGLMRRRELYKTGKGKERVTTSINQYRELVRLKETEFPWLKDIARSVPQESLRSLDKAHRKFFRYIREKKKIGRPGFKKRGKHDSFVLNGCLHAYGNYVKLTRIGIVRVKEDTSKIRGRITSATITRKADRWFISFIVKHERPKPKAVKGDIVGIDLGLKNFATIYNGKEFINIPSPMPLRKYIKKIKVLSQRKSNKKKGSCNRRKAVIKLAKAYLRVSNIRRDFLSKLSTSLAKTKSMIIIEDLNVKGLERNRHLSRSIGDVGWGMFRRMLEYKTQWYGSRLTKINRFEPSSKTCSECGAVNTELVLSDRIWICQECGYTHDRDENAAKNIRSVGMANTDGSSEIKACGVAVRPRLKKASDVEAGSGRTHRTEFLWKGG